MLVMDVKVKVLILYIPSKNNLTSETDTSLGFEFFVNLNAVYQIMLHGKNYKWELCVKKKTF